MGTRFKKKCTYQLACAEEVLDGVLVMITDLPSTAGELLEEVDSALMSKYKLLEDC